MSDVDKDTTKPKKYSNPNEIHPRAQAKLEELQRRGLIGKNVQVVQPKKPETEQEDDKQ